MKAHGFKVLQQERGIVLILTMLVMVVMSILGLAFLMTAKTEDTIAANYRNHTAAFYAAEAGVESGFQQLKANLATNPNISDADLAKIVPAALSDPNYTFSPFQVRRIRPTPYLTTLDSGPYVGLNAMSTAYEISATAVGPRGSRARLTQRVNYVEIPLFQFAIFNGRGVDLEITPNPAALITGRVHTNSDLYLRERTDLKFDGRITSAGKILRYVKPYGTGVREANPQIKDAAGNYQRLNFDHDSNVGFAGTWSEGEWAKKALEIFGGTVKDSAHGVQEILPPIPSAFYDPNNPQVSSHQLIESANAGDTPEMKAAKMQYKADLVLVDENAYDQTGKDLTSDVNKCKGGGGAKAVAKKSFYDPREMADITITEIDVALLNSCKLMPANGIVYAYRTGVKPKKGYGIRLKNGSELPTQGLTVASEDPVYVMGDYNTVNKKAAAVMGDAIYVLSNNWDKNGYDNKTKDDVTKRTAADTTVNAAFMMGPHAESKLAEPNGNGFNENIIRFLEDWRAGAPKPTSNTSLTYSGSLVSLWHSQEAKAAFNRPDGKDYRTPPNRWWSYDTLFDTQLPPGTPMGIIITRGQWSEG